MNEKGDLKDIPGKELSEMLDQGRERFNIDYIEAYMDLVKHIDILDGVHTNK